MSDEQPVTRPVDPTFDRGKTVIIKSTGERALLIGSGDALRNPSAKGYAYISTAFSRHMYRGHPVDDLEIAAPLPKKSGYDLKEDFEPFMSGLKPVPNFKPYEGNPLEFLNSLTLGGQWTPPGAGYAEVYHEGQSQKGWAKYFLSTTQGGGFDGTGYVIIYASPRWVAATELKEQHKEGGAIIGSFAICKHQKVDHAGANHQRGWHPGHCLHCGLDMTVDSGD